MWRRPPRRRGSRAAARAEGRKGGRRRASHGRSPRSTRCRRARPRPSRSAPPPCRWAFSRRRG
ncbi:hypothetical protein F5972_20225 [Microbispora cellulosiformans]|uniref:Uncharacterized protein n=1 Tax=Microbispora cellulosiformans TaxID=2614688 RepID=A0A5J5K3B3_9ACTN|nr:hypothetical protein F5972_20225 [Microbispora cellulosiformans]